MVYGKSFFETIFGKLALVKHATGIVYQHINTI